MGYLISLVRAVSAFVLAFNSYIIELIETQKSLSGTSYNVLICPNAKLIYIGLGVVISSAIVGTVCSKNIIVKVFGWAILVILMVIEVGVFLGWLFGPIKAAVFIYLLLSVLVLKAALTEEIRDLPSEDGKEL